MSNPLPAASPSSLLSVPSASPPSETHKTSRTGTKKPVKIRAIKVQHDVWMFRSMVTAYTRDSTKLARSVKISNVSKVYGCSTDIRVLRIHVFRVDDRLPCPNAFCVSGRASGLGLLSSVLHVEMHVASYNHILPHTTRIYRFWEESEMRAVLANYSYSETEPHDLV